MGCRDKKYFFKEERGGKSSLSLVLDGKNAYLCTHVQN